MSIYSIVDLHAITVPYKQEELRANCRYCTVAFDFAVDCPSCER